MMKSLRSLFKALSLLFDVLNQKPNVGKETETDSFDINPKDETFFKAVQTDMRDLE